MSDDTGQIEFRTTDAKTRRLNLDGPHAVTAEQIASFNATLNQIQHWQSPTDLPPPKNAIALDATSWHLEGVWDGRYHVTLRVCHGQTPLGKAAWELFDLVGHKPVGRC
jgi:hypothetical protein